MKVREINKWKKEIPRKCDCRNQQTILKASLHGLPISRVALDKPILSDSHDFSCVLLLSFCKLLGLLFMHGVLTCYGDKSRFRTPGS